MLNRVIQVNENYYKIENESITAMVKENFREGVLSVTIVKVPGDPDEAIAAIKQFIRYLINKVGGKIWLKFSPEIKEEVLSHSRANEIFNQKCHDTSIKLISKEIWWDYLESFYNNNVKAITNNPHFQWLVDESDYQDRYGELYYFKKKNSTFNLKLFGVNTRIKKSVGLYSEKGEENKIKNTFVQHFAIFNTITEDFIATLQFFIDNDLAYISDVVVNKNTQKNDYVLALAIFAFKSLRSSNPQIKDIWLVGDDNIFNGHQLSQQEVTPRMQQKLGVLPIVTPPKEWLINAGMEINPISSNYVKNSLWAGAAIAAIGVAAAVVKNHYVGKKI